MNLSAPKYFIVEKADIGWIRTTVCTAIALIAFAGLIYLVLPGWEAPPMGDAALMTAAGIAWGVYSLRGRGVANPIAVTGDNFLRSVAVVLLISLGALPHLNVSFKGAFLAFLSGAVTSGLGYVVWYAALRDLTATRAASVQLLVPVIAALGGVIFLSEPINLRLVVSSIMIIGGVGSIFLISGDWACTGRLRADRAPDALPSFITILPRIDQILKQGSQKARAAAGPMLARIRRKIGITLGIDE